MALSIAPSVMASSPTLPPIDSVESDYVSIEEARSMANESEAGEMPSFLKDNIPDKSTTRPYKDATQSVFPITSLNYLSISPTKETSDISVKEEPTESMNLNLSRFFKNLTKQNADVNDFTINGTVSANYSVLEYDQDYDYSEDTNEDRNATIEYHTSPAEGSDRKYNMDINRTKQRLDASEVTDNDVTQMNKKEASTTDKQHRPLSKQTVKPKERNVFKPQPHIANHHKRGMYLSDN